MSKVMRDQFIAEMEWAMVPDDQCPPDELARRVEWRRKRDEEYRNQPISEWGWYRMSEHLEREGVEYTPEIGKRLHELMQMQLEANGRLHEKLRAVASVVHEWGCCGSGQV